jgi:5-formyltetrahydrofolate cyclo-ligase
MSEVGSGMNIGSDYSGTEKTEKTDKATLRHHILSRRKRVPAEERGAAGELLVRRFPAHMIQDGPTVAAYVSMGSEIETRPLLRWLRAHGCHVLVPRLGSGLEIGWSVLDSLESLRSMDAVGGANNAGSCSSPSTVHHGPDEPSSSTVHHRPDEPTGAVLPPEALEKADLVIAPALAVDPQGNRLGRGAGWYDRALARRKPACPLIAVCWPWEVLDIDLPAEPHDVPADGVLTPEGYRRLSSSGRLS